MSTRFGANGTRLALRTRISRVLIPILLAPLFSFIPTVIAPSFFEPAHAAQVSSLAAPTVTSVTAGAGALVVVWTAPPSYTGSSTVTGYQVEYSTDGTTYTTAATALSTSTLNYTINGLAGGTPYYVRVAALCATGYGAYGYYWTKLYSTSNPLRNSTTTKIEYDAGFGLSATGSQASNTLATANFSRVRYTFQLNSGNEFAKVDFNKFSSNTLTAGQGANTTSSSAAATIANLAVPDPTNAYAIKTTVSDMNVYSSDYTLNTAGTSGHLEIWPYNYAWDKNSNYSFGDGGKFDANDQIAANGWYGAFQVFDISPATPKTIFAWNNHGPATGGLPDLGINSNATQPDWTFQGSTASQRTGFNLSVWINVPVAPAAASVITSGLIMNLDANSAASYSGSGNTWTDLSSNHYDATLNNGTGTYLYSYDSTNHAITFTNNDTSQNSGSYASIGTSIPATTSWPGLSVSATAKMNNTGSYNWARIFDFSADGWSQGTGAKGGIFLARDYTTNHMILQISSASGSLSGCEATNIIDNNVFHNYAVTVSSTGLCTFYRDGTAWGTYMVGSTSTTQTSYQMSAGYLPPASAKTSLWIGRSHWNDAYLNGSIKNLAIYNSTLTAAEISTNNSAQTAAFSAAPPVSNIATLNTATIKGVTAPLGTASSTLGSESPGSISLTTAVATGSVATNFVTTDSWATTRIVKLSSGTIENQANFDAATALSNGTTTTIANGDFFLIKVTSSDNTTIKYYRINTFSCTSLSSITYAAGSGGTGTGPTTPAGACVGSTFITPANTYTQALYDFAGWSDGTSVYAAGVIYPNSGSVAGNVTLTATWRKAPQNEVCFNGTNQSLSLTTGANLPLNNDWYTIEAFVKTTAVGTNGGFVGWGAYGTTKAVTAFRLYENTTTPGLINYQWGNDLVATSPSGNLITNGAWHHVVAESNGTNMWIYQDGILTGTMASSGHAVTQYNNFTIGVTNGNEWFKGCMSNLRIVKGVKVYSGTSTTTANFAVPTSRLTATQSSSTNIDAITGSQTVLLMNNTNNILLDASNSGYTLTANNSPTIDAGGPGPGFTSPVISYTAATVLPGGSVSVTPASTGSTVTGYSVSAGTPLPSTLALNATTGVISGTAPTSYGTYTYTINAADGSGNSSSANFVLQVSRLTPTITTSLTNPSPSSGTANTINASSSVPGVITFQNSSVNMTGCVNISTTGSGPYTASCPWTPKGGDYSFTATITPTDASSYVSATSTALTGTVGGPGSFAVTGSDNGLIIELPAAKAIANNSAYTVEAWVKIDAGTNPVATGAQDYGRLDFSNGTTGDQWNQRTGTWDSRYGSYYITNNGDTFHPRCDGSTGTAADCPLIVIPRGVWTHLALQKSVTAGVTRITMFIDGKVVSTGVVSNSGTYSMTIFKIGKFGASLSGSKVSYSQMRVTSGSLYPTSVTKGTTAFNPTYDWSTTVSGSTVSSGATVVALFKPQNTSVPSSLSDASGNLATLRLSTSGTSVTAVSDFAAPPPPVFSYSPASVSTTTGTPFSSNPTPVSTGGDINSYRISPALPTGLNLDTTTGIISGTPTASSPTTTYSVVGTQSSSGLEYTATVTITVNKPATTTTISLYNSAVQVGVIDTITATTSVAGTVSFQTDLGVIPGCSAVATTTVSPFKAYCPWNPSSAYYTITGTLTPTSTEQGTSTSIPITNIRGSLSVTSTGPTTYPGDSQGLGANNTLRLNFPTGTGIVTSQAFTIETWVKVNNPVLIMDINAFYGNGFYGDRGNGITIFGNSTRILDFLSGSVAGDVTPTVPIVAANTWVNIVYQRNYVQGNALQSFDTVFVNGVPIASFGTGSWLQGDPASQGKSTGVRIGPFTGTALIGPTQVLSSAAYPVTGFSPSTTYSFGANTLALFQPSPTSCSSGAVAPSNVTATTGDSTAACSALYPVALPAVSSVTANTGPTAGQNTVKISGANFVDVSSVNFGSSGVALTDYTINTFGTEITAKVPAGSGVVDVTVTTAGGTSTTSAGSKYTYVAAPTISSLSPSQGAAAGGSGVIITGTGFTNASVVTFGSTTATNFTVNSPTQITTNFPASSGIVNVKVTAPGGTSLDTTSNFTYTTLTSISSITPTSGSTLGGTSVEITGTNFLDVTAVKFGSTNATSFTINSATKITAVSPSTQSAGVVGVSVVVGGVTSTLDAAFTYTTAVAITAISKTFGPTTGGTIVEISGTNLSASSTVLFGTTAGTNVSYNSGTNRLSVTSPALSAGQVDIRVTTAGTQSVIVNEDKFTYFAPPTVTGLSQLTGPLSGSTSLLINGTNFTSLSTVVFGSTTATVSNITSTQITVTSPVATTAGAVDVRVTNQGGTSSSVAADIFTYYALPKVTSISPSSGTANGGTVVTITGENFTGATGVKFGTADAVPTVVSSTQITATAPSGSGDVNVTVITPGGTSAIALYGKYTYVALPVITSISPSSGMISGGQDIIINGTGLNGLLSTGGVLFGSIPIQGSPTVIVSGTQIRVVSPVTTVLGQVDIFAVNGSGSSLASSASKFTYTMANDAKLSALTLSQGTLAGGFSSTTNAYTSSVVNSVDRVTVTPTVNQVNATVQIKVGSGTYETVTSGTASSNLPLVVGANTISIQVTAQDQTVNTYTITLTRLSNIATLSSTTSIKGVVPTFGTPSSTLTSEIAGAVTLTNAQGAGVAVSSFTATDVGATINKIAKFASTTTESLDNFSAATAFANGSNATILNGDYFLIKVTAGDGTIKYTRIIVTVLPAPPTLSSATITGTPQVGSTLNAVAGTITGVGTATAYQWQIATTSGGTYSDIASATTNSYIQLSSDSGKFIRVVITVSNNGGSAVQISLPTSAVALIPRTITIDPASYASSYTMLNSPDTLTATASVGGGTKSYFSNTPTVCTVAPNTGFVSFVSAGSCSLAASIATDGTYATVNSAPITFVLTRVAQQALVISPLVGTQGTTTLLSATGGSGTGALSFQSFTAGCTVNNGSQGWGLTTTRPLSCLIEADKAGDTIYAPAFITATIVVSAASTSLTLTLPNNAVYVSLNEPSTFTAAADQPGTISFLLNGVAITGCQNKATLSNVATCTLTATSITPNTEVVSANFTPTSQNYAASSASLTVAINTSSLAGLDASKLTALTSATIVHGLSTTLTTTDQLNNAGLSITIPSGALPDSTIISVYVSSDITKAQQFIPSSMYLLNDIVAWHAPDGSIPLASIPLSLKVTNAGIRTGMTVYGVISGIVTPLGKATQNGEVTVSITEDPLVVIAPTKPDAPTSVTATTNQNQSSLVSWVAPANDGGQDITGYTVTASGGGGQSCTTTGALSCRVLGLTNGTAYTFTVTATNAVGTSSASSQSASITPVGLPTITTPSSGLTATYQSPFSLTIAATGPASIQSYSVATGSLPAGLSLNSISGVISGTPTTAGSYQGISITATDSNSQSATTSLFTITVNQLTVGATLGIDPTTIASTGTAYTATITPTFTRVGTSTGAITYSASNGTATGCSITPSGTLTLTATTSGTCYIRATQAADTNYAQTTTAQIAFTFTKASQVALVITSLSGQVGTALTLTATGGSGTGAKSYSTTSTGCSITGSSLTATQVGTCSVTVNNPGDTYYSPASTTAEITIGQSPLNLPTNIQISSPSATSLTVTFTGDSRGSTDLNLYANATTTTPLQTLHSFTSGSSVPGLTPGTTYYLTLTSIGTTNYASSAESSRLSQATLSQAVQPTVSISPATSSVTLGQAVTLSASASATDSGVLSYQWSFGGSAINGATSASYSFTPTTTAQAGTYTVTVTNTKNGTTATRAATSTLNIAGALSILTPTTGLTGTVGTAFSLIISAGGGSSPLTFAIASGASQLATVGLTLNTALGSITGTPSAAGSADIAVRATDSNAQSVTTTTFTITIAKASQSVVFSLSTSSATSNGTAFISPLGSIVSNPGVGTGSITYAVSNASATGCAITNPSTIESITATSAGTCQIVATKAADANYFQAVSAPLTFTFTQATQAALSMTSALNGTLGTPLTLSSSGGTGTGTVTYSALGTGCSISGSTLNASIATSCTVSATNPGDTYYAAITSAPVSINFGLILLAAPSITAVTTNQTTTSLVVTYTADSHGTSVTLYLYSAATGGSPLKSVTNFVSGTAVTGLTPSTKYYAALSSVGSSTYANSAESLRVAGTTLASALAPIIDIQPTASSLQTTVGIVETLTVTAHSADGATLAYQWNFGDSAIPNATSATYVFTPISVLQSGNYSVTITETLTATTASVTSSRVAITVGGPIQIATPSAGLGATEGFAFSLGITANGGTAPLTFSVTTGLADLTRVGLSLNAATGVISGTPTETGTVTVRVRATDAAGAIATTDPFVIDIVYDPDAPTPTFSATTSTATGFTVRVTNYDAAYTWAAGITAGSITNSIPSGSSWLLTVVGLTPSQSATITVTASAVGFQPMSSNVTGSALAAVVSTPAPSTSTPTPSTPTPTPAPPVQTVAPVELPSSFIKQSPMKISLTGNTLTCSPADLQFSYKGNPGVPTAFELFSITFLADGKVIAAFNALTGARTLNIDGLQRGVSYTCQQDVRQQNTSATFDSHNFGLEYAMAQSDRVATRKITSDYYATLSRVASTFQKQSALLAQQLANKKISRTAYNDLVIANRKTWRAAQDAAAVARTQALAALKASDRLTLQAAGISVYLP